MVDFQGDVTPGDNPHPLPGDGEPVKDLTAEVDFRDCKAQAETGAATGDSFGTDIKETKNAILDLHEFQSNNRCSLS